MRSEEVEIIVTTNVEETLKDLNKVNPQIKQIAKQIQESILRIDFKALVNKVSNVVNFIGSKMKILKKILENDELKIKE